MQVSCLKTRIIFIEWKNARNVSEKSIYIDNANFCLFRVVGWCLILVVKCLVFFFYCEANHYLICLSRRILVIAKQINSLIGL